MLITRQPHNESLIPVLVYRERLEYLWELNNDPDIITWDEPPCCGWFSYSGDRPHVFHVADCIMTTTNGQNTIKFWNGRHRTRWLLNNTNLSQIPIGIRNDSIDIATSEELISRVLAKDDVVNICWYPPYIDFGKRLSLPQTYKILIRNTCDIRTRNNQPCYKNEKNP